jgi:SAM-dependent methyltransferase
MRNAVILLTVRPNKGQVDFFRQMEREGLDLFVLADDNQVDKDVYEGINLIQIDDRLCRDKGFRRFNPMIPKPFECSAWDKALYYFSSVNTSYDHVWIIEEDVFITAPDTIPRLDSKYGEADIISAANNVNETGELESWFWWRHIPVNALPLPWAWSMVCGVRLSRAALQAVKEFVAREEAQNAGCLNIEFVFHTLALHQGLKVIVAEELRGVVWRKDWSTPELLDDGLYHPIKDVERHAVLRKEIESLKLHKQQGNDDMGKTDALAGHYGEGFYRGHDQIYQMARRYVDFLCSALGYSPLSVIDAGCGHGVWLKAFKDAGAQKVVGFDGPWNKQSDMVDQSIAFHAVDLNVPITEKHKDKYDLAMSVEVAEHLEEASAEGFVRSLVQLSDVVLFGAAYIKQGGANHINEQRHTYWASKFISNDFLAYDLFRPAFWGSDIHWWYQQNTFLYVNRSSGVVQKLAEAGYHPMQNIGFMDCVHPTLYEARAAHS